MHRRDGFDLSTGILAIAADAAVIFGGLMLAVWIRFFSGWMPSPVSLPPMDLYWQGAGVATLIFILVFTALGLYERPQLGSFGEKIPRLVRAVLWSFGLAMIMAFAIRTEPPFSRLTVGLSFFTVLGLLLTERYILFSVEIFLAKRQSTRNRVAILGTGESAATLKRTLENDPRLRSEVTCFFAIGNQQPDPRIPPELIRGSLEDLQTHIDSEITNHVILSETTLSHAEMVDIIVKCERSMLGFHFVPDLFRVLTGRVDMLRLGSVPLIGRGRWPLDHAGNRFLKRTEDIAGALVGLLISAPFITIFMVMVKLSSPGPVFYRQERFGESGKLFTIYKLRTMLVDAESRSGPVWTRRNDPRRTRLGVLMRRFNIDELPQFWNVLKGDMSLVGPRPERPQFVGQFKEDIGGYMWRHIYKPGMTGWAQVNGFRGDTGLEERIKHDLFYLEHWSLAFDFKILVKTVFARENAY